MKNSYPGPQVHLTRLANIDIRVKFRSRNSEVFKIYTKYPSFLVYNQVYNLFVCTLCPCLTSVLKWNWDKPLRNSLWLDMTLVTWKSRLRLDCVTWTWHNSDYFWFASQKKNIFNPHVIGMPLNEQFQFFAHAVLSSQTSRIPDETQKNPRTENLNPPSTRSPSTKFPSPNFRALNSKFSVKD